MSARTPRITREQAQVMEDVGRELLRTGDRRGLVLLSAHLAWRSAATAAPRSSTLEHMAEVIALDTYSRRVES